MKKFGKWILIGIITLAIIMGAFIFSPLLSMSVKKGIEHFGTKTLHTEVSVGRVSINVFKGNVEITDLEIANPEGFSDSHAFKMNKVFVDMDLGSIKRDVIIINSILIDSPEIVLEKLGKNLKKLTANIEKPVKEETPKTEQGIETKSEKKIAIKELKIINSSVVVGNLQLNISDILLKDLGTADNAANIKDIISKVLNTITKDSLKTLTNQGKEIGKKALKNLEDDIKDKFKGFF